MAIGDLYQRIQNGTQGTLRQPTGSGFASGIGDWFAQNAPTGFKAASNTANGIANDPNQALIQLGYDLNQMQQLQGAPGSMGLPVPPAISSGPTGQINPGLNPNAGFGTGPLMGPNGQAAPPMGGSSPSGGSTGGGSLRDQVVQLANQIGRPDIANNPDYWVGVIQQQGPNVDWGYWTDRMKSANQGGSVGASNFGGTNAQSGYGAVPMGSLQTSNTITPGNFTEPTAAQYMQSPGVKFALQAAQDAVERSVASKGTLLTGGTLKELAGYEEGVAGGLANDAFQRQLQAATLNQNIGSSNAYYGLAANNQNYNQLYNLAGLGQRSVLGVG